MGCQGRGVLDWTAIVLFAASILLLLLTLIEIGTFKVLEKPRVYSYRGSDYPREWDLPPLQRAQITMENSVHFAYNTTLGEKEWEAALPSGGGMLHFGENMEEPYTISMFHQIRCLNVIRKGLIKFEDGGRMQKPDALVHHCMNYLRQMVLCRSDLQLEHARHLARGIVVSDITHSTCKDWTAVYEAAEENHRMYQVHRAK
ncbi:hypothetical protein FA15DRAFT_670435 [Coprinopsis marcescibilis]|uniref:Uncharacterized protein n=1 Tax=Coprinopsis marcescibilis TaxID=230819 RepID=A0A5C3KUI9_COPMA|nr:hypothetical protein FA15DRAFT_670435 [Coprinopsis marcescibilis]